MTTITLGTKTIETTLSEYGIEQALREYEQSRARLARDHEERKNSEALTNERRAIAGKLRKLGIELQTAESWRFRSERERADLERKSTWSATAGEPYTLTLGENELKYLLVLRSTTELVFTEDIVEKLSLGKPYLARQYTVALPAQSE